MWNLLGLYGDDLKPAIDLLHHATQFVAMITNSYLPKRSDDSQNSLTWNSLSKRLEGNHIESVDLLVALDVVGFKLVVESPNRSQHDILLDGKTKQQVLVSLLLCLREFGLDGEKIHPITQFTIPPHAVDRGEAFAKPPEGLLIEWTKWLSNAQIILDAIRLLYPRASTVRVWPHHFDMGLYMPVARDEAGKDTQGIGAGLAIPDAQVGALYFYINHWSVRPLDYPWIDPKIRHGYWHHEGWKGFVLPFDLMTSDTAASQENMVKVFFDEGIQTTLTLLNQSQKN